MLDDAEKKMRTILSFVFRNNEENVKVHSLNSGKVQQPPS